MKILVHPRNNPVSVLGSFLEPHFALSKLTYKFRNYTKSKQPNPNYRLPVIFLRKKSKYCHILILCSFQTFSFSLFLIFAQMKYYPRSDCIN